MEFLLVEVSGVELFGRLRAAPGADRRTTVCAAHGGAVRVWEEREGACAQGPGAPAVTITLDGVIASLARMRTRLSR